VAVDPGTAAVFWPQGIAVIELAHRYLKKAACTVGKEIFGDFHGFLSGWCYWTNNIFYVPTVCSISSASRLRRGPRARGWPIMPWFALGASMVLLALLVVLNVLASRGQVG